ncbi:MAG: class I SAM-dependent methyltransferase [Jatrophihabitans sp.]|uniref:class I SAM-dependent methyltransferase n=1 Tax=Jatrophihabitans sp. TaxID=1932789 RepID=UPI003F821CAE
MNRHEFLQGLHTKLKPRTYLETGINDGKSLALSRVPSIGIDPAFAITQELQADVHLVRTTSDEFFARSEPLAHLPIPVLDLAFIDGMHLAEYALRDYLGVERFTTASSVVVFDDMLPRTIDEAARKRHTHFWTGDVYKAAEALREQRPDLIVLEVDTQPTGVVVVLLPDASRDGVLPGYDDWMDVAMAPDPQDVPQAVLTRSRALNPETLLASKGWAELRRLRGRPDTPQLRERIRAAFGDVVR